MTLLRGRKSPIYHLDFSSWHACCVLGSKSKMQQKDWQSSITPADLTQMILQDRTFVYQEQFLGFGEEGEGSWNLDGVFIRTSCWKQKPCKTKQFSPPKNRLQDYYNWKNLDFSAVVQSSGMKGYFAEIEFITLRGKVHLWTIASWFDLECFWLKYRKVGYISLLVRNQFASNELNTAANNVLESNNLTKK